MEDKSIYFILFKKNIQIFCAVFCKFRKSGN